MPSGKYRTGIIGLGRIGFFLGFDRKREQPASHSSAFAGNSRTFLAGGFDTDPVKRDEWHKVYKKARIYKTLSEMLNDGSWDILIAAVPEESHLKVMNEILPFHPRLVVLEKPAAANLREAVQIERLSGRLKVPVLINHERRYSRDYILLQNLIKSKLYGEVKSLYGRLFTPSPAWMRKDENYGRGALLRDGTHIIDILRFLTGSDLKIESALSSKKDKKGSVSGISCMGRIGEAPLFISLGFQTKQFEFEIDITFQKSRARIGNGLFELWEAEESPYYEGFYSLKRERHIKVFRKTHYFSGMVQNCVDFLDGKLPIASALKDGIEALKIIERIIESAGIKHK